MSELEAKIRDEIIEWWKYCDMDFILRDDLEQMISYEIVKYPIEKTRQIIDQAIKYQILIENKEKETLHVHPTIQSEIEEWQTAGKKKLSKIRALLDKKWRPQFEPSQSSQFDVLKNDIIDVITNKRAGKLRASSIKIENLDFDDRIEGIAIDKTKEGKKTEFPFLIDNSKKHIVHNCPEMQKYQENSIQFCSHLARLLMKLYAKDGETTVKWLEHLIHSKAAWQMQ